VNVLLWAELLPRVHPGVPEVPERNATSATDQVTLPGTARRLKTTATAAMALDTSQENAQICPPRGTHPLPEMLQEATVPMQATALLPTCATIVPSLDISRVTAQKVSVCVTCAMNQGTSAVTAPMKTRVVAVAPGPVDPVTIVLSQVILLASALRMTASVISAIEVDILAEIVLKTKETLLDPAELSALFVGKLGTYPTNAPKGGRSKRNAVTLAETSDTSLKTVQMLMRPVSGVRALDTSHAIAQNASPVESSGTWPEIAKLRLNFICSGWATFEC